MDMKTNLETDKTSQILAKFVKGVSLQKETQSKNLNSHQTLLWRLCGLGGDVQTVKYLTDLKTHVL